MGIILFVGTEEIEFSTQSCEWNLINAFKTIFFWFYVNMSEGKRKRENQKLSLVAILVRYFLRKVVLNMLAHYYSTEIPNLFFWNLAFGL